MIARRCLSLSLLVAAVCVASAGCAVDPKSIATGDGDDDNIHVGDGSSPDDELVAERQLNGSEMADKTISLTFDDGPGRRTSELADYLAEKGVKGAFFINGMKVPGRQAALDSIVGRGHLLANHTQNHKQLTKLSAASVVQEVSETDAILAQIQPNGPWIVRAPFGAWNASVARAINGTPMRKYVGSVFWDTGGELTASSAADWDCWGKGVSVEHCGELYLKEIHTKKHGVILMHDIHDKTVDMVKVILPTLIAEGYTFTGLDEVPSVKRAIASVSDAPPPADDQCPSATLGRSVNENTCVQSRSSQKWYRCVDGEWSASTGPTDTTCIARFPL